MAPVALIASIAMGAAQLAQAGASDMPDPSKEAAKAEGKRRRLVKSRAGQRSHRTSVLAGEAPDPQVYRPRLLGES